MKIELDDAELWQYLEPKIQGLITDRIIVFHDALLERGQIPAALPPGVSIEETPYDSGIIHCTEDCVD